MASIRLLAVGCAALLCGAATGGDRRATATLVVSATVLAECAVDDASQPAAQPGCRPLSVRALHSSAVAAIRSPPSNDARAVPTNGASSGGPTVVLIRF